MLHRNTAMTHLPHLSGERFSASACCQARQRLPVEYDLMNAPRDELRKRLTFREDSLRNRAGHSAQNLSRIRRLALNLLRKEKTCKVGAKGKRLKACLEPDYLLKVISQGV